MGKSQIAYNSTKTTQTLPQDGDKHTMIAMKFLKIFQKKAKIQHFDPKLVRNLLRFIKNKNPCSLIHHKLTINDHKCANRP